MKSLILRSGPINLDRSIPMKNRDKHHIAIFCGFREKIKGS